MSRTFAVPPILAAALVAGCAAAPTRPSTMALPGTGKPLEQFRADDSACRQWAAQQIASIQSPSQQQYDMAYLQCMYAKGNQIPVAAGSSRYTSTPAAEPTPPSVPPPPAGTPPPPPPGPTR